MSLDSKMDLLRASGDDVLGVKQGLDKQTIDEMRTYAKELVEALKVRSRPSMSCRARVPSRALQTLTPVPLSLSLSLSS